MAKKRRPLRKKKSRALTPEDDAFLGDIMAAPEDDAPRLRYADWLEANGDPERAEFIRLDIHLARTPWEQDPDDWWQRRDRMWALRDTYREDWLAAVPEPMRSFVWFVRGFPGKLSCDIQEFLCWDETVWQASPMTKLLTTLCLTTEVLYSGDSEAVEAFRNSIGGYVEALAAAPQLAHIRHLGMGQSGILTRHVQPLLASPYLTELLTLDLSSNGLGDGAARAVAESPRLPSLVALHLGSNRIGDKGAAALAASPHLTRLSELVLRENVIGDQGGRALAASRHLRGLRKLDLTDNKLGGRARAALRKRFGERVAFSP